MLSGLMGRVRQVISNPFFIYAVLSLILLFSVGHYLGTHPKGLSPAEANTKSASLSLSNLYHNPVNAPHNLVSFLIHKLGTSWATALRLSSALLWLAFSAGFYKLAKTWFGRSIGLMGTLMLAFTPIFLIMGRDGSPAVMFLIIALISATYLWATRPEVNQLSIFCLIILCALSLYVPGLIIWLLVAGVICRRKLGSVLHDGEPPVIAAAVLIGILLLVPLAAGLIKDWTLLKQLMLIPDHLGDPLKIVKNIVWMFLALIIKAPHASQFMIGRLPVLNILADALLIFGSYALWSAARLKLLALAGTVAYAVIFAGLNDNINLLALAVPSLAIIMTAGLRYLFIEWRGIFPHNPLAKNLALTLMWAVVITQLLFGVRYAVLAWPSTTDTQQTYVLK